MGLVVAVILISVFLVWQSSKKTKTASRGQKIKQIKSQETPPKPPQQRSPKLDGIITDVKKGNSVASKAPSAGKQSKFGDDYHDYTLPFERHKSLNLLRGMIAGASCDGAITDKELAEIAGWCNAQVSLYDLEPFFQLHSIEYRFISTGRISDNDRETLLTGYMHPSTIRKRIDEKTSELQFLTGLCYGLISDAELTDFEVQALDDWLSTNKNLKGSFLYDNLSELVSKALESSPIQGEDRIALYCFIGDLVDFRYSTNLSASGLEELKREHGIKSFVETDAVITLSGHAICFAGQSPKASHDELLSILEQCGALYREHVSSKTDYLIVLDVPDPAWSFPRYGRKFERGIELMQSGAKLRIVSEAAFWNAVADV